MSEQLETTIPWEPVLITGRQRGKENVRLLGGDVMRYMRFENFVFDTMSNITKGAYDGGYWEFYKTPNDVFFMVPTAPENGDKWTITNDGLQRDVEVTAEAAGIICALHAYSNLSFSDEFFGEFYYKMLDAMQEHPEVSNIYIAID